MWYQHYTIYTSKPTSANLQRTCGGLIYSNAILSDALHMYSGMYPTIPLNKGETGHMAIILYYV